MTALLMLAALQVKHWLVDFYDQTMEEVNHKGIYGNWLGMKHSVKHGVGTFLIFFMLFEYEVSVVMAFAVAIIDFITHYHIDWIKMNWGNRDITTPQFWNHLGLDQMAHQLVYLALIGIIIL